MTRRPGQNIRGLQAQYRTKAIAAWAGAGVTVAAPFVLVRGIDHWIQQNFYPNATQAPSLQVPVAVYGLFALIALGLALKGWNWWQWAKKAKQGAIGEEVIGQVLEPLMQEGWQLEFNTMRHDRKADIDVIATSPRGQVYTLDVKSHGGLVTVEGDRLMRRLKNKTLSFEKDFLKDALAQAIYVKETRGLRFVTPMVVFSRATVSVPVEKIRHVYVIDKDHLVPLLRSLR